MFFNRLSILIWLGLAFALLFPYWGFELSRLGLPVLLLMSIVSFFPLKIRTLMRVNFHFSQLLFGLLICYTLFPALQMILASFFLDSKSLQLGVLLASLSPVAIIAPQLLSSVEKQQIHSLLYVVISTLLFPLLVFAFIHLYNLQTLSLPFLPLLRDSLIITLVPLLFSIFFDFIAPKTKERIVPIVNKIAPFINYSAIAFLVFVYFGSAFTKSSIEQFSLKTLMGLGVISLFQDFGTFYLAKFLGLSRQDAVSFALKNVALSGGILLIFHPQAVLGCSSVFIAHALFFSFMTKPIERFET